MFYAKNSDTNLLYVNYGFAGTLAETESIEIKIVDPGPETDRGPWTMDGGP